MNELSTAIWIERFTRRETLALATKAITAALGIGCVLLLISVGQQLFSTYHDSTMLVEQLNAYKPISPNRPASGAEVKEADLSALSSKSIFGTLSINSGNKPAQQVATPKDPLALIGTFVTDGQPPYAIIEDEKKKVQDVFGVGEPVFGDGSIKRILADRVEIERAGAIEVLLLDLNADDAGGAASGGSSGSGNMVVLQEAEYTQALENLPLLLTQARAVPYFKDGRAQGLRLFAVKAGSFYERLGLKNGDVLKSINGNSLADLSQAMQLLEKLRSERSFSINLDRNTEPTELQYEIR